MHFCSLCETGLDSEGEELAFCVAGEKLEDDEELRLHILGCHTLYTKRRAQLLLIMLDGVELG